jgi:hypothetical protein
MFELGAAVACQGHSAEFELTRRADAVHGIPDDAPECINAFGLEETACLSAVEDELSIMKRRSTFVAATCLARVTNGPGGASGPLSASPLSPSPLSPGPLPPVAAPPVPALPPAVPLDPAEPPVPARPPLGLPPSSGEPQNSQQFDSRCWTAKRISLRVIGPRMNDMAQRGCRSTVPCFEYAFGRACPNRCSDCDPPATPSRGEHEDLRARQQQRRGLFIY